MKKLVLIGLVVVLALTLTVGIAGAAPQGPSGDFDGKRNLSGPGQGLGMGNAYGFVDENGDGVNDRFVDENNDGQCDLAGQGQGAAYGRNAKNGAAGQAGAQAGMGKAQRGNGTPMARFVDADGNGICDLLEKR